ncbi:RagB/SusD family nutrient uptake outer membrane protein [Polaribacter batillariae]|uniref:RagB/SusD family nutrient uptake outer membrane protein n=1 Tax=Polaribacter batillariae TaxID=2808900 RepID=A0ABX7SSS6_9FLAO|nr:RagB/SusD family nutrient uptake outer membrane protein [Polaribacter batillariae]QTD37295.1 RagB/SusD family nutrient uptake outer membrane protein [Polaribacter batillariae]
MKTIYFTFLVLLLVSCNDDYLERFPQTEISEKNFFNNVSDLETYSYQFYDYLGASFWDRPSDNTTVEKGAIRRLMLGNVTADNSSGWGKNNWSRLRSINFFLDNFEKAQGNQEDINKFAAMGYFSRAMFYINKVQTFSDVPWYGTVLNTNSEELYKPRDTREFVVEKIIADLEFATTNLKSEGDKTILSKWAAYAQLARFCLYEGTYRQYHAGEQDLNVTTPPKYFYDKAIEAANAIINSNEFSIQSGNYGDLFNGVIDLAGSPETIMYLDYEDDKREHGAELVLDYENGVSRSMADSYLKLDGTFMTSTDTETLEINDAFTGRDPRMVQSLFYPGYIVPTDTNPYKLPIGKTGGYAQIKFMPNERDTHWDGFATVHTDLPLYRYAEVLLIYAEAKAELGELTQSDLDKSINKLRSRVGVAPLKINPPIDPSQEALYPNVSSSQKAEILEVRRERRVELFGEGHRYTDMMRWKVGKIFEKPQRGIYVPPSGLVDITGDGVADYFISDDGSNDPGNLPSGITRLITSEDTVPIFLEFGKSGHIMFKLEQTSIGTFVEPKYYYRPIPTNEVLVNPELKQIFGW